MLNRDNVLAVLKQKGPCLPVHIRQALGAGDTFTIGAILSELKEAGKLKISNTKRGGSPFYYVPEHAHRLAEHVQDLGEKDRRAAQLLKERKILRDNEQDPLTRVCLRQIKDFATPIEVKTKEATELFWKWYLLPNAEAETLVKQALGIAAPPIPQAEPATEPTPKPAETATPPPAPTPSPTPQPPEQRPAPEKTVEKLKPAPPPPPPTPQPATKILKEQDDTGDAFLKKVLTYFAEKHIQVITKDVKRKNADIEFEISMPTAVGRVDYFCKAKHKKKCNDGDLSSAYLQGQAKKLPVLFITTGDVVKKTKDKLKHEYKGLVLIEL